MVSCGRDRWREDNAILEIMLASPPLIWGGE